jgi:hypothetical protein
MMLSLMRAWLMSEESFCWLQRLEITCTCRLADAEELASSSNLPHQLHSMQLTHVGQLVTTPPILPRPNPRISKTSSLLESSISTLLQPRSDSKLVEAYLIVRFTYQRITPSVMHHGHHGIGIVSIECVDKHTMMVCCRSRTPKCRVVPILGLLSPKISVNLRAVRKSSLSLPFVCGWCEHYKTLRHHFLGSK